MRLLLANNHLGLGGSESYLLTVAEQLDRLGHEVSIYAAERGLGTEVALDRGLGLIGEAELDDDFDAALVQDAGVSLQIAAHCPGVPQLFVAHSGMFDLQAPPQLPGIVGAIVVLNDRIADRMRSFATGVDVVRLRQPIDTQRFTPRGSLPEVPRRALLLSNNPNADRLTLLQSACENVGIELERVGGAAGQTVDPRPQLAAADVVIGYGRSILEAMACGRAAYVYDWKGGDGWVTADSYPGIEAEGFAGCSDEMPDVERLTDDLHRYSASMGPVNHDLIYAHHRANLHAQELVKLARGLGEAPERPRAPLQEMARLVRLEWRARGELQAMARESAHLHGRLIESESARSADAERAGEVLQQVRSEYETSPSWRITAPLRSLNRLLGRMRSRLSRPHRERA
ncbi:MAG TPA: hypothetical protein VFU04_05165 [Solirubrobacterales bacterium]|nr:hypothetical protein [Solirubrobacterales bacterium]